jgi:hypothetical protein
MSQTIKTYSDLVGLSTLEERFRYLSLRGKVGESTFGFDRWMNQQFYRSTEWKSLRRHIIVRDNGCDLGIDGYEIHTGLVIHHLNPMTVADIRDSNPEILDPEFLITTTLPTHNAIHYGDERLLPRLLVKRKPGDTKLW